MRGKVKDVRRNEVFVAGQQDWPRHDVHATRFTNTYAILYNGENVCVNENDIRRFYGCQRITKTCIAKLKNALQNKVIEYSRNWNGDCYLVGSVSNYIYSSSNL